MKALILNRSSGVSGGEYQSVMTIPPKGSAEERGINDKVSIVALHKKLFTPIEVAFAVFSFAEPPKIVRPSEPNIESGLVPS